MGEAEGRLYFRDGLCPGVDASKPCEDHGGPLPVARAVALGRQLLAGLAYAHGLGYVHRDIKPPNLLVAAEGGIARLADFGLAKAYRASQIGGLTLRGDVGGTIAFMAPEQVTDFRGSGPSVDLYAAGATLYHLLTGHLVYDLPRTLPAQLAMLLGEPPVPIRARRPDLPAALAEMIGGSLSREPRRPVRPIDANAMREALHALRLRAIESRDLVTYLEAGPPSSPNFFAAQLLERERRRGVRAHSGPARYAPVLTS